MSTTGRFYLPLVILPLAAVVSLVIYFGTHRHRPPPYVGLIAFLSFAVSLIWMYILAKLTVAMLRIGGHILGAPQAFMGALFLALGNTIPGSFCVHNLR